jgi:hypothetical protein
MCGLLPQMWKWWHYCVLLQQNVVVAIKIVAIDQISYSELTKPDDYQRCLDKQVETSKMRSTNASRKRDVTQLGEHAKQSVSPLKVLSSQDHCLNVFASEAGLSVTQLLCNDLPKVDLEWTYKKGGRLVTVEKEKSLPTQMRKLHEWYMVAVKQEGEMLIVRVRNEHYLGEDEIHVEFEELFHLLNQDILDKSFISCYCL